MTSYDFDTFIDRRNTGSAKWDWFGDVLPMWVADMDFRSPEPILNALHERVDHGVFGYQIDSAKLREMLVRRMARRYGWTIEQKDIQFVPNVVSPLNVISRAFSEPGDGILMLTPAYPPFLSAPKNGGREAVLAELAVTKQGQILRYEIDFDAMEAAITPSTKVFFLCNPHNPVGRAWTKAELEKIADICLRHDLIICSDEIHCDLLLDGTRHIPIATLAPEVSARTVTLMAPSKTFNIPTLGLGFVIAENPDVAAKFNTEAEGIVPHVGAVGYVAAEAAYGECQDWLDALLVYLQGNRDYLVQYVQEHFSNVPIAIPEATYLAWTDWRGAQLPDTPFKFFLENAKVAYSNGKDFGEPGDGFLRINFGCPRSQLVEALERTRAAVEAVAGV
jgi:cystathionine beta-lyase